MSTIDVAFPLPTKLHQVRLPVAHLIGREEAIDELTAHLAKTNGSSRAGIFGGDGLGKSELAYAVASQISDVFPDAQIRIDLQGSTSTPLSPELVLKHIIAIFTPEIAIPTELAAL